MESVLNNIEYAKEKIIDKASKVDSKDLKEAGQLAALSLTAYYASIKLYDAFFGPLSGIPGPFAQKFYSMHYSRKMENPPGTSWEQLMTWHKQYGKVVRLGPNRISVADKDMVQQVLMTDDFPKGPSYNRLQRLGGVSMLSTIDKAVHKQRRRIVSPAFSIKYLNSLEPFMAKTNDAMVTRIDNDIAKTHNADGYGTVDMWLIFQYLALDIIGETAFGETFNMLEKSDHPVPRAITKNMQTGSYLMSHPILGVLRSMYSVGSTSVVSANLELKKFMKKIIMERLKGGEEARRNDILQILIDSQQAHHADDRLTADTIARETVLFLVAGSETTSNTTGFAFVELLKHPEIMEKLRAEIDAIPVKDDQNLTHEQLKHLPYLNAVINETLRMNTIVSAGVERIAPKDVVLGGKQFVPKGTIIHSNFYCVHLDPEYWPEPNKFIPERWIDGSSMPADKNAFFPFSAGSRNCLGKQFAYQEMRLSIATLVRLFDFKAIPEEIANSDERRCFLTLAVKSNSFKVLMKRRNTASL
ncbi:p450 monooxygenase [Lichtheimia corymbifera JMRC:FSU:9682]|uniref:P450 monooxygenase n=2 Tax=Lichtheimia corymbifera JMRC:FSU:9682 TaxID=1263082 RepID=A0A068S4W6_9FUNG|nr:p450 monooxygenase [Lichtheimia corymbifera JMRC:FSU:9682]